jgi:PhnB protein
MAVAPIPPGYASVTPYLIIRGAAKAIDFYKHAFGAVELFRLEGPGGSIGHAEISRWARMSKTSRRRKSTAASRK